MAAMTFRERHAFQGSRPGSVENGATDAKWTERAPGLGSAASSGGGSSANIDS